MAELLAPGFYRYTLLVGGEPLAGFVRVDQADWTADHVRDFLARQYFPGGDAVVDGLVLEPLTR